MYFHLLLLFGAFRKYSGEASPSVLCQHSLQRCSVYAPCESLTSWYSKCFNSNTLLVPWHQFPSQRRVPWGNTLAWHALSRSRSRLSSRNAVRSWGSRALPTSSYANSIPAYFYQCDSSTSIPLGNVPPMSRLHHFVKRTINEERTVFTLGTSPTCGDLLAAALLIFPALLRCIFHLDILIAFLTLPSLLQPRARICHCDSSPQTALSS